MNVYDEEWLKQVFGHSFTVNSDDSVDINGKISLSCTQTEVLPVKFNKVTDSVWLASNGMKSLHNSPEHVDGSFYCYNNNLTSLEGCPNYVGKSFKAYNNKLTTLEYCPKYVGGEFHCWSNNIFYAYEYRWILYSTVIGEIDTGYQHVNEVLNMYKNDRKSLPKAFSILKKMKPLR